MADTRGSGRVPRHGCRPSSTSGRPRWTAPRRDWRRRSGNSPWRGINLVTRRLIADAPGVITDLKLEVGQVVAAGQTVFSLAHTAETEIVVDVPENRLPDVRAARSVTIRLWSQPDVELKGRVREIGALADPVSRTFAVKVTVVDAPSSATAGGGARLIRWERAHWALV